MIHVLGSLFIYLTTSFNALPPSTSIQGIFWSPDKDGKIEFYEKDGRVYGRTVWSLEPEIKDIHNPDPKLRDRLLMGADCFLSFQLDGDRWKGQVYDSREGKTYECLLWLTEGGKILKARGYIGLPVLGQTVEFERIQ